MLTAHVPQFTILRSNKECARINQKKVSKKEDGIVQKQIIHSSHVLVPPKETEQMCITMADTLTQSDALALQSVGSSLLELDIRQAR